MDINTSTAQGQSQGYLPCTLQGKGDPKVYVHGLDDEAQRLIVLDIESEIMTAASREKRHEIGGMWNLDIPYIIHLLNLRRMVMNEMALRATDDEVARLEKLNAKLASLSAHLTERMDMQRKDVCKTSFPEDWKGGHCRVEGIMECEYDDSSPLPKLPSDSSYGSDFTFIHELISDLQSSDAYTGKFMEFPTRTTGATPTEADEYLSSDVFKHIDAGPALRALCDLQPFSIPDVARIKDIKATAKVVYEHNFYDVNTERIKYYGFK